jgi:hypothetical protein
MDRLEEVFYQLGMDVPENINLPSYEIIWIEVGNSILLSISTFSFQFGDW